MVKECKICRIVKPVEQFHTCGKYKETQYYRGECIECSNNGRRGTKNEYSREYNARPEIKERRKKYKESLKLKESYKEDQRKYGRNKYATDPLYKLKKCLRVRIVYALKANGWIKNNRTKEIVGCSYEELKSHIESQFDSQMTWENHGVFWEIDHSIALGFGDTIEELYKLCHYTNLRPLNIEDHKAKTKEDTKAIKKKNRENQ